MTIATTTTRRTRNSIKLISFIKLFKQQAFPRRRRRRRCLLSVVVVVVVVVVVAGRG